MDSNSMIGIATALACGVCLGYFIRKRLNPSVLHHGVDKMASVMSNDGNCKLILVVRTDLKMGKGKVAAQCSHAAVSAYEKLGKLDPKMLEDWRWNGQPKVVVKTDTEESLIELAEHARSLGLCASIVQDAGRTQIAAGSRTVLGVGPGPTELVDEVTGHLKLF